MGCSRNRRRHRRVGVAIERRKIKRQYEDLLGIRVEKLKGRILNRERINKTIEGVYFICVVCKKVCHNMDDGFVEDPNNTHNMCAACSKTKGAKGIVFNGFTPAGTPFATQKAALEALAAKGVIAGVPASRLLPRGFDHLLIVATTETNTDDDFAALTSALKEVL